ncbi:transcriptional regulator protein [Micromonospora sp. LOL_025]|uniref:ParB/RepB/Spo0J family partition protein n=1 Tax=Micromonospora sp. LOL_025 TaxID=3345413 RepID=UPI003A8BEF14
MSGQPERGHDRGAGRSPDLFAVRSGEVEHVEVGSLRDGLSPRLTGISPAHVQRLAGLTDDLPPIVVHRSSRRVIDGSHRLAAARARGERIVPVVYFDGSDADAFVAAVRLNAAHGMPLPAQDRSAAARRILTTHPHWSDRWIASVCRVAPRTVAALRGGSTDDDGRLNARLGRDGRSHPVSAEAGRRLAADIMRRQPDVSLREVARRAGISVGTAFDVRRKLATADATDAHPAPTTAPVDPARPETEPASAVRERLAVLVRDPSLRYTDQGRALLRLASATLAFAPRTELIAEAVPGHCRGSLHAVAVACAGSWRAFAEELADPERTAHAG